MRKVIPKHKVHMVCPVSFLAVKCMFVDLLCEGLGPISLVCLHITHSSAAVKKIKALRR